MKLIEITKNNWEKVIFLTTNKDNLYTLGEEFVASNAYSIVQSFYEEEWIIKAIEHKEELIGFAMYGFSEEEQYYEICRFMIDRKFQGKGYGTEALALIVEDMKQQFGCSEVYLSTESNNVIGIHVYEKCGFVKTGKVIEDEDEDLYVLKL